MKIAILGTGLMGSALTEAAIKSWPRSYCI